MCLSPNIVPPNDYIRVRAINTHRHNNQQCDFCAVPMTATTVVTRQVSMTKTLCYFACSNCAIGWIEVGDRFNPTVI